MKAATDIDWDSIELDYRMGISVATISRDTGVPADDIRAVALLENWGVNNTISGYLTTYRYKVFAEEYLKDFNRLRATKAAGYLSARPPDLLKRVEVKVILEQRLKELTEATDVTVNRLLAEYSKLAFYDASDLFDSTGRPLPIKDLPKALKAAVVGLKVTDEFEGKGDQRQQIGTLKEYKLADKQRALDSLGKYLNMFTDKVEVKDTTPDKPEPTQNETARRIAFLFKQAFSKKE